MAMLPRVAVSLALIGCTPVEAPTTAKTREDLLVPAQPDAQPEAEPHTCLARYQLDSQHSVLDEQRSQAGAKRWSDFAERYAAAYLDPDADHPVEVVADYRIGGTPLLWFTADYAAAVVNAAVLTELKIVDATSLHVGERIEIGTLTELGLGGLRGTAWGDGSIGDGPSQLSGRELTQFLLKAGVIQTYVHIGSTLCLLREVDDERGYRAEFTGEHEYYTNEENHDPLAFALDIAADGRITITGAEPAPLPAAAPSSSSP